MSDTTILTQKEQYKFDILTKVINKEIKPGHAAKLLGISIRQARRLKTSLKINGPIVLRHGLTGKQGNHQIDPLVKEKALTILKETYPDFKPLFASEKLEENHNIRITPQTARIWMTEAKLWKPRKQKHTEYHSWRPRKEYYGELLQFDGSYHMWFEDRFVDENGDPIEVCLLASIDDATGEITNAQFLANEGIVAVFTFWMGYVLEIGKPIVIYLDKFSTYKINHKAAVDNKDLLTQFQRAMRQLDINPICANSAQAKGRVERLFGTLQDRLVKEMRLSKISSPTDGNKFLKEVFIPKFNEKFSVVPAKEGDVHRGLQQTEKEQLNHIFSIQDTRRINLDFTIQFKNNWYQLTEIQPTTVYPLKRVLMETWLDGTIHIILKNHELAYLLLPEKPKKQRIKQPIILTTHTLSYKPPLGHPWRRYPKK
ncbi:MAG TPA: ISNCY family transposase [Patescibacteria group bacterium]|nr:ISNCY family transposase [Patescibacteria group bacterium]